MIIISIYETCPDTDPNLIGLSYVSQLETGFNQPFSECGNYMSSVDCQKDLGFTAVSSIIQPGHTPASASGTLSNGAGTVTSPASGAVFTYTNAADSQVYTISAASSSGGDGAKKSGKGSSDATATAESSGSSKHSNSGAAVHHSVVGGFGGILGLVTILVIMG